MHQRWPNLQLQIVEAVEDKLATALVNKEVDVVLSGPIPESDELMQVAEHPFSDRSMVIAATTHPWQSRAHVPVEELAQAPWVMPSTDAEPRKRFDGLMQRLGYTPPRVVVETRSPSTIKAVVARTQFLGWLPEPLFAAEQAAGLISPLQCPELTAPRRFYIYRRRRNFIPPPLLELLHALLES
jgi:DNA-binding transcriptional LysR family regulator